MSREFWLDIRKAILIILVAICREALQDKFEDAVIRAREANEMRIFEP
jgi:hypothetical protein